MASPVEEKPFEGEVYMVCVASHRYQIIERATGVQVAYLEADADRVEEIVRLINASVEQVDEIDYAFPQAFSIRDRGVSTGGLTKREWFAGQAIVGLYQFISELNWGNDLGPDSITTIAAEVAFQIADAMEAACSKAASP